jgi:hypothetical protein
MDFTKFLTNLSEKVKPTAFSTEELCQDVHRVVDEVIEYVGPELTSEEEIIQDFSNPTFLTNKSVEWKLTDYKFHAFILGREYRPEWAAAAMYLASWLRRRNCKAKIVVPAKWMKTHIPKWFDRDLIFYDTQVVDLIDGDFSFWFWGFEGKTHWLDKNVRKELMEDRLRLQVVDAHDRNRWMSDQVIRLKPEDGGITAFVFWICVYSGDHEYLRMALRESKESSWMTHPDFQTES